MGQVVLLFQSTSELRPKVKVVIRSATSEEECYLTVTDPHKGEDSRCHSRDQVFAVINRLRVYAKLRNLRFDVKDRTETQRLVRPDYRAR